MWLKPQVRRWLESCKKHFDLRVSCLETWCVQSPRAKMFLRLNFKEKAAAFPLILTEQKITFTRNSAQEGLGRQKVGKESFLVKMWGAAL